MFSKKSRNAARVLSPCALTLIASICGGGGALAEEAPAHLDLSQPHPQPPYPGSALAGREEGSVLLDVYVEPDGRAAKYRVAQSSGFGDLDDAAVQSVLNWHFVPAERNGDPVSDWTAVKIVFQLPQPPTPPPEQVSPPAR